MGIIGDFLSAPRRLRELGRKYDEFRYRCQAAKADLKAKAGAAARRAVLAERRMREMKEEVDFSRELAKEVERLRKLNGETNMKYVIAQDAYDQLLQGKARRI